MRNLRLCTGHPTRSCFRSTWLRGQTSLCPETTYGLSTSVGDATAIIRGAIYRSVLTTKQAAHVLLPACERRSGQQAPGADAVDAFCLFLRLWPRGSGATLGDSITRNGDYQHDSSCSLHTACCWLLGWAGASGERGVFLPSPFFHRPSSDHSRGLVHHRSGRDLRSSDQGLRFDWPPSLAQPAR